MLGQGPREYGIERTRWTLASLLQALTGLSVHSEAGLWQVFQRLDIRYRQGWSFLVSPDPLTEVKLAYLEAARARAQADPERVRLLYLDELTFYRLPTPAPCWADACLTRGPKAQLAAGSNTKARIGATLDHVSGQVCYLLRSKFGVSQLCMFYQMIREAYPDAQEIYLVQDCWPVHFLPAVTQTAARLHLSLLPLPTYSSWRNPIEKLWRWLKQDVLHMHGWAQDWLQTKSQVACFLDQFLEPNSQVLRYVGLPY